MSAAAAAAATGPSGASGADERGVKLTGASIAELVGELGGDESGLESVRCPAAAARVLSHCAARAGLPKRRSRRGIPL